MGFDGNTEYSEYRSMFCGRQSDDNLFLNFLVPFQLTASLLMEETRRA
jgi:hypothetical protein